MEAVIAANMGTAMPYGNDPLTDTAKALIGTVFERNGDQAPAVHLVGSGTAANGLALAQVVPPFGAVICHANAHVNDSECGGPELQTGGAKLLGLTGENGKLDPATVAATIDKFSDGDPHHAPPRALSLTNATETGQIYTPDEVAALAKVAHAGGLAVHMDGARFANAVAGAGCTPADMTWKAGVDVLSFGGTKNGCMAAEAVVVFTSAYAHDAKFRVKRSGHVWSKSRFLAAQYVGYLSDGNWLAYARHANAMASRLAEGLARVDGCGLMFPVAANQLFLTMAPAIRQRLRGAGYDFYDLPGMGADVIRLVTAHDTLEEDVDGFLATAAQAAAA